MWLCGRVAAELDGAPLEMPTSERARALIGWLALHPGAAPALRGRRRGCGRRSPETSARANLRTAVWAVRSAWGDAADAWSGARTTLGLRRPGVGRRRPDDARRADADGELLPGVDDEWVRTARAEHRDGRPTQLADRADVADARRPTWPTAVRRSRRAARAAPLDEAAHRELLRRLLPRGRAGRAAVLASREFGERLRAELGVRPSPATRAVHAEVRAAGAGAAQPPLFGRADELAALRRGGGRPRRARPGRGAHAARPGIGKTHPARRAGPPGRGVRRAARGRAAGIDVGWRDAVRGLARARPGARRRGRAGRRRPPAGRSS